MDGETPTLCPWALTSSQPRLCPGSRSDGNCQGPEMALCPARLVLRARSRRSLRRQGGGTAGLITARLPVTLRQGSDAPYDEFPSL